MSDWLERELARELAPAAAPEELAARLGFAPVKRWQLPRLGLTVAAAVAMVIAGSYAASRTEWLDLRGAPGVGASLRPKEGMQLGDARVLRCDGGADTPIRLDAGKATVLLAHDGFERSAHRLAAAAEADCRFCHSL
jgi:hypothetical protein